MIVEDKTINKYWIKLKNVDPDKVYQSRQNQLKKWDDECIWRGVFVLSVIVSLGLFLL